MFSYKTPGVYREEVFPKPSPELRTGVPAFLGLADRGELNTLQIITLWSEFEQYFGPPLPSGHLAYSVRGFFENGGRLCYVVRLDPIVSAEEALRRGLDELARADTIDLVCAPDIMRPRGSHGLPPDRYEVGKMQSEVLRHCDQLEDRFAILDSLPRANGEEVSQQRGTLSGQNGALYYPWVRVPGGPAWTDGFVPPCGHVAGVFALTDERVGVHKAPANEVLEGVSDLEVNLSHAQQALLNPEGINCLRSFPGRGLRVWGARTLSDDPAWTYVNVRRLFLTVGRWIERNMAAAAFEPHGPGLWARLGRELTAYFHELFRKGALMGPTAEEAFYVKCDGETNPAEMREAGMVVTEVGLTPSVPGEFVAVRIIHSASGVSIAGHARPE